MNLNKCHVLPIHGKFNLNTLSCYTLNGSRLSNLTVTSDLSVFVDSNLTFNEHICTVITKAQQRVGVFSRVCFLLVGHRSQNFTTYIRPILESNSNVWNPSHKYLIDQLENVQHRFTKRITYYNSVL